MSYYELGPRQIRYGQLGLGQHAGETPDIKPLPWGGDDEPAPTASEVREQKWERAGLYLGVLATLSGLLIALPELIAMAKRRRARRGR